MPSGLQSSSFTIGEIFSGPFLLNVPVYQRPYAWGKEQAAQLLDDIQEAAGIDGSGDTHADYFLGTILLMDSSAAKNVRLGLKMPAREFDIVDGQQRLVTLLTLIAVLRDLEANKNSAIAKRAQGMIVAQQGARFFRTERYRLHVASRERTAFERWILTPGATKTEPGDTDVTGAEAALIEMRDLFVSTLRELSPAERAALFEYICTHCEVVVILSHDIDRAHLMFIVLNERGKRLQRNDILKADVISRLPSNEIDWANKEWDTAAARIGDDFETFFSHLRSIYAYNKPQVVSGVRAVMQAEGGASPFLRNAFLPLAHTYSVMRNSAAHEDGGLTPSMRKHLHYLNRLADGDWAPAALLALKDRSSYPDKTERILAEIDRIAHLLRILCVGTGKRKRRFAAIVTAIRDGTAGDPTHPAFQITRDEVRNIAYHLRDLHKRNPKICKLLLFRLNDELSGERTLAEPEDYTIEHVLPQRLPKTSEWNRMYPQAEERNRLTESLGNLVLITLKQNEKARNALFATKKQIYTEPDGRKLLLPITRQILKNEQWLPQDIDAREEQLFALVRQIWRIDLPVQERSSEVKASA